MEVKELLRDRKYWPLYAVLAAALVLSGAGLRRAAAEKEGEASALASACGTWEHFTAAPVDTETLPDTLLSPGDTSSYVDALEEAGLSISSVAEDVRGEENFHTIRVTGTGSFSQILSAFDIISSKEEWNAVDLLSLRRQGNALSFDMEVATFQRRSSYEKEKYRPHRTDGDRKEPGGEDYR